MIESRESNSFCLFKADKKRVVWEITHKCNYSCKHCCSSAGKVDISKELSFAQVNKVLNEMVEYGIEEIYYSGGEPFCRGDFLGILESTTACNISFNVSTNGSYITPELANRIKGLNIKKLHVSLDSHLPEKYNYFREGDFFDQTIKAIKIIKESGLYLRVGVVLWSQNINDIKQIIEFLVSLSVNEVVFSWPVSVGRLSYNSQLSLPPNLHEKISNLICEYREKYKNVIIVSMHRDRPFSPCTENCPGGVNLLHIYPDGKISPCSWASKLDKDFISSDTLIDKSLQDIIASTPFQKWKQMVNDRQEQYGAGCPAICLERNKTYYSTDPLLLS